MNGRILHEPTADRRIAALVFSIVITRFNEFRAKYPNRTDVIFIEEFLDYHDLDEPLAVALDKEFLIVRITENTDNEARKTILKRRLEKVEDEVKQLIARLRL